MKIRKSKKIRKCSKFPKNRKKFKKTKNRVFCESWEVGGESICSFLSRRGIQLKIEVMNMVK